VRPGRAAPVRGRGGRDGRPAGGGVRRGRRCAAVPGVPGGSAQRRGARERRERVAPRVPRRRPGGARGARRRARTVRGGRGVRARGRPRRTHAARGGPPRRRRDPTGRPGGPRRAGAAGGGAGRGGRVAIADDHRVLRVGLEQLLTTFDDVELVGTADGGQAAVSLCVEDTPDVLLLDLSMPDLDGIGVTRALAEAAPTTKVVIFT